MRRTNSDKDMKNTKIKTIVLVGIRKLLFVGISVLLFVAISVPQAYGAQLYFYPQNIESFEGETFVVEIRLNTEDKTVNALDISGSIDNGIIEAISTDSSLVQIFINSSYTETTFRIAGGTPGGFSGNDVLARLNVHATELGRINIAFDESANILAGTGESLASPIKFLTAAANIKVPSENQIVITSRSHSNQNEWYNKDNLNLHWTLEEGVQYSYLVSRDSSASPDNSPNRPEGTLQWQGDINIEGLDNGIYYFTLKRVGESEISRYRAMIDTTPPEWIAVELSDGVPETMYKDFVTFIAKDNLSGISHYNVRVDDNPVEVIEPPYILPKNYGKITITAYDNAGNLVEKTVLSSEEKSAYALYVVVTLIVLGGMIVWIRPIRERVFTQETKQK